MELAIHKIKTESGFEWMVTETKCSDTPHALACNTSPIGMFVSEELAMEYLKKREKINAKRQRSASNS